MRWLQSNIRRHRLLWLLWTVSWTGCSHPLGNEYFCPPEPAYDQTGQIRTDRYAVERVCYRSMTEKLAACYAVSP